MEDLRKDELMHHGRKGQKWGKKNGPPYPLDYKDLSAEEVKQAKANAIARGDKDELKINFSHFTNKEANALIDRFNINQRISELSKNEMPEKMVKLENMANKMGTFANALGKGTNMYNASAKIANALFGKDFPVIGADRKTTRWESEKLDKNGKVIGKEIKTLINGVERTQKFDFMSDISKADKNNKDRKNDKKETKMDKLQKKIDKLNEKEKYQNKLNEYQNKKDKIENDKYLKKAEENTEKINDRYSSLNMTQTIANWATNANISDLYNFDFSKYLRKR